MCSCTKNFNRQIGLNQQIVTLMALILIGNLFINIGKKVWVYIVCAKHYLLASGEPGLVDRVPALHAGGRGFDSHRGHMSEWFFQSNRPGYPHPVSSELENSSIRVAVIAVSLNVSGGVRLIKPAKLYMCTQNTTNTTRMTHVAGCVRQWFRTAEPLRERCYENWNTHTLSISS